MRVFLSFLAGFTFSLVFLSSPKGLAQTKEPEPLKMTGRVQYDFAFFDEEGTAPLSDTHDIRRLRLVLSGDVGDGWSYETSVDYSNSDTAPDIVDFWIGHRFSDSFSMKLGQHIENLGIEQVNGSLNQSFVERSILHDAFNPERRFGLSGTYAADRKTLALGIYGQPMDDMGDLDRSPYAISGRATYAPLITEDQTFHLGVSLRYASPDQKTDNVRYDIRPGTRLSFDTYAAEISVPDVDYALTSGFELVAQWHTFTLQAEWQENSNKRSQLGDADFSGGYAHLSWFVTGEKRVYDTGSGRLRRIKPATPVFEGGWGALEIAARHATVDLQDGLLNGGKTRTSQLALNWYPTDQLRFDLNYIHNDLTGSPDFGTADPDVVVLRTQFDF